MLHKRLYYIKDGDLVKSFAPMSAKELVELLSDASEAVEAQEQPKKLSCKEKVMEVVSPMLKPISQAVFNHESKLKELEKSKVSEDYFEEMLAVINKALSNQQEEIDELIARQKSKDEEESTATVACVLPTQMAFLLRFSTQQDFEKAEPCLRSLSDLLEHNDVNFELIEL
jgi:hypothetical protein